MYRHYRRTTRSKTRNFKAREVQSIVGCSNPCNGIRVPTTESCNPRLFDFKHFVGVRGNKKPVMKESEMTHEQRMEFFAKETMKKTKDTAGWMSFFGIVAILSLVLFGFLYFK